MTEDVENLGLQHLRATRADVARTAERLDSAETVVNRQHMAGVTGAQTLRASEIAGLKVRLDRVERRPELVD